MNFTEMLVTGCLPALAILAPVALILACDIRDALSRRKGN